MYEMAKKARHSLRSKAAKLASEKDSKVDSSDWTPAEPLNADVKTGMRPISRRAFKTGGKVSGECGTTRADRKMRKSGGRSEATEYALAKVNRNVKEANEDREGIKHVGGMKRGGRAEKETGGGLFMNGRRIPSATAGKPIVDKTEQRASTPAEIKRAEAHMSQMGKSVSTDKGMSADEARKFLEGRKEGGRTKKMMGGPMMGDSRMGIVKSKRMDFGQGAQGTPYKKGGRITEKDEEYTNLRKSSGTQVMKKGGKVHTDEAMDKALIKKMVKPEARTARKEGGKVEKVMHEFKEGKLHSGSKHGPEVKSRKQAVAIALSEAGKSRAARKDGGRTKAKGKTNINILINAGKEESSMPSPAMMGGRPPAMPIPAPAPGLGAGPGMPMPAMGPAPSPAAIPPGMPMPRKTGGRVSKVAKSYKDMEAGAASGEGRLQKTDIAARIPKKKEDGENVYEGKGYPNKVPGATGGRTAHKAGGRTYRSYKDMDAGAGSGLGRLEKTEIERRK